MVKVCSKCKTEKELTEFNKYKRSKDGLRTWCKSCKKEYNKEYKKANKEHLQEYIKKYHQENKENRKEYIKKYYQENKERIKEYKKKYHQENKGRIKENSKKYYQENKEKYNQRNKEYRKQRRKTDTLFKLKCNLRNRTWVAFKSQGYSKNTKTREMLGVDWQVAKNYIERKFTKGMNWDNYGEWHIDHIIPLSSAKTPERLKQLCHYTNLQPMWAEENLSKKDKIIGQQTLLRI